jgi:FAD:protein FMN transferase
MTSAHVATTQPSTQVERHARIMATEIGVHVAVPAGRDDEAIAAADAFLVWCREVERPLTRFDPASELCRLNGAGGAWFGASEMLYAVVEHSLVAARATDGLFDPALLPLLEALGYDRDIALIDGREVDIAWRVPHAALRTGRWREIELDPARRAIRLPEGVRLDLGGIVKGWTADVALDRFFAHVPGVLLNVGGDMRVRGEPERGEGWPVGIGHPRAGEAGQPEHAAVVTLRAGALATSGSTGRWWYRAGTRQHHLLDPRASAAARLWIDTADDGPEASTLIATATAFAPTATHAEVAAKAAVLRGYPAALDVVETAWKADRGDDGPAAYGDQRVALLLVLGSGDVICSRNLRAWLEQYGGGGELWLD